MLGQKEISVMDAKDKEAVKLLKELVESPHVEYGRGDDDPGACIHCGKVSYKPHEKDCVWKRADDFLERNGLR